MTIHINNSKIADVYYGNQAIQEVYYGSALVYCRNITLTIVTTPENATVEWTVDGVKTIGKSIVITKGKIVSYKVSANGYWTVQATLTPTSSQTINVTLQASDFPQEWGKYKKADCTLTLSSDVKTWMYGFSLHFENGILPMTAGYNDTSKTIAQVDKTLFQKIVNNAANGAVYKNDIWQGCVATNEADYMLWTDLNGRAAKVLLYPTAATMGWPNSSVFTTDFSFSVVNNKLRINKKGVAFATFTVVV